MRCEQSERWISLGADQELSVKEVGLLREHLAQCASCQALAEEVRGMSRWFVTPPKEVIPAGFAERVVAAAFDEQRQASKGPQGLLVGGAAAEAGTGGSRMQGFLLQMTALAALLLVALGFALAGKQASESRDLKADVNSLESLIKIMDKENALENVQGIKDPLKEDSKKVKSDEDDAE
ncbi:MAG: anti-sigma factor RsiW [Planctomycetota bacterium]|jgi:anti-sigma factor RsiW